MSRLTDNDINFGPLTLGRWTKRFEISWSSGSSDEGVGNSLRVVGFGWAARLLLPAILKPNGKYGEYETEFSICLSDMGNGYDFLSIYYGPQTHDSRTTKSWCYHLPWKQWRHVRSSLYKPDGSHFYTEGKEGFSHFCEMKGRCPSVQFEFQDFDGEKLTATAKIVEREWRKGERYFKWLSWFYPKKVVRSLDLWFSGETGPEKGSWKGGTIGHGIDLKPAETPLAAFQRYCDTEHNARGRKYKLTFIREVPATQ